MRRRRKRIRRRRRRRRRTLYKYLLIHGQSSNLYFGAN
jgi:hypothetical protein